MVSHPPVKSGKYTTRHKDTKGTKGTKGNAAEPPVVSALCVTFFAFVSLLLCTPAFVSLVYSHEIPADVTVQTFFRPEGQKLHVALRVPLAAMRDMDYPKRNGIINSENLDLARADKTLRDAATLWIARLSPRL